MKVRKSFIFYAIVWLLALVMFLAITFVIPKNFLAKTEVEENVPVIENGVVVGTEDVETKVSKYENPVFWVSFAFVVISFLGQLACSFIACIGEDKKFLGIPFMYTSVGALVIMTVIGSVCMVFYRFLGWLGIIVCILAFGFNAISVVLSKAAGEKAGEVDKKIKAKTMYIKMLTADAQTTIAKAESDEMKKIATKVYEAVRYSDPMSDPALQPVEEKITEKFSEFDSAVVDGNLEEAEATSKALIILITERNTKCRMLK